MLEKSGGLWKKFPKELLRYRTRARALKDKFPDIMTGVTIAEYDYHTIPKDGGTKKIDLSDDEADITNTINEEFKPTPEEVAEKVDVIETEIKEKISEKPMTIHDKICKQKEEMVDVVEAGATVISDDPVIDKAVKEDIEAQVKEESAGDYIINVTNNKDIRGKKISDVPPKELSRLLKLCKEFVKKNPQDNSTEELCDKIAIFLTTGAR